MQQTVLVAVPSFPQRRGIPQTYKGLVQRAGFLHNVPAGTSLQVFPYRENYACQSVPVGMYLQADKPLFPLPLVHITGGALRGARGGAP